LIHNFSVFLVILALLIDLSARYNQDLVLIAVFEGKISSLIIIIGKSQP